MSERYPRNIDPNSLVEITWRTPMGQYLLVPSTELNEIVVGVLGYFLRETAERRRGVRLCGVHAMSNHLHILGVFADTDHMSHYMQVVGGKLSKEVRRLVKDKVWPGHLWGQRYAHVEVTVEPEAQIKRLKYLLSQGVIKEKLVDRPTQWPGVSSAAALMTGRPLVGRWFNRTKEWAAWQRNETLTSEEASEEVEIHLAPLPCWEHLPPGEVQRLAAEMVGAIEEEADANRRAEGRVLKTEKQIRDLTKVSRTKRPESFKPSPAPLVHAASYRARREFRQAFSEIVRAYREAAERLRMGDREAVFPPGTFPPGLPFVPAIARPPP